MEVEEDVQECSKNNPNDHCAVNLESSVATVSNPETLASSEKLPMEVVCNGLPVTDPEEVRASDGVVVNDHGDVNSEISVAAVSIPETVASSENVCLELDCNSLPVSNPEGARASEGVVANDHRAVNLDSSVAASLIPETVASSENVPMELECNGLPVTDIKEVKVSEGVAVNGQNAANLDISVAAGSIPETLASSENLPMELDCNGLPVTDPEEVTASQGVVVNGHGAVNLNISAAAGSIPETLARSEILSMELECNGFPVSDYEEVRASESVVVNDHSAVNLNIFAAAGPIPETLASSENLPMELQCNGLPVTDPEEVRGSDGVVANDHRVVNSESSVAALSTLETVASSEKLRLELDCNRLPDTDPEEVRASEGVVANDHHAVNSESSVAALSTPETVASSENLRLELECNGLPVKDPEEVRVSQGVVVDDDLRGLKSSPRFQRLASFDLNDSLLKDDECGDDCEEKFGALVEVSEPECKVASTMKLSDEGTSGDSQRSSMESPCHESHVTQPVGKALESVACEPQEQHIVMDSSPYNKRKVLLDINDSPKKDDKCEVDYYDSPDIPIHVLAAGKEVTLTRVPQHFIGMKDVEEPCRLQISNHLKENSNDSLKKDEKCRDDYYDSSGVPIHLSATGKEVPLPRVPQHFIGIKHSEEPSRLEIGNHLEEDIDDLPPGVHWGPRGYLRGVWDYARKAAHQAKINSVEASLAQKRVRELESQVHSLNEAMKFWRQKALHVMERSTCLGSSVAPLLILPVTETGLPGTEEPFFRLPSSPQPSTSNTALHSRSPATPPPVPFTSTSIGTGFTPIRNPLVDLVRESPQSGPTVSVGLSPGGGIVPWNLDHTPERRGPPSFLPSLAAPPSVRGSPQSGPTVSVGLSPGGGIVPWNLDHTPERRGPPSFLPSLAAPPSVQTGPFTPMASCKASPPSIGEAVKLSRARRVRFDDIGDQRLIRNPDLLSAPVPKKQRTG